MVQRRLRSLGAYWSTLRRGGCAAGSGRGPRGRLGGTPVPSPRWRGRGDLGDQRQNMQFPVEIERLRLPLRVADAVPQASNLVHLERSGLDVAGISREPAVKL